MGLDHQSSNLIHTRNNVLFFWWTTLAFLICDPYVFSISLTPIYLFGLSRVFFFISPLFLSSPFLSSCYVCLMIYVFWLIQPRLSGSRADCPVLLFIYFQCFFCAVSGPVRSAHLSGFDILFLFFSFLVFFGYVLWYLGNASLVCLWFL